MSRSIAASMLLLLGTIIFLSTGVTAEEEPAGSKNPFAGKIVTVYLNGPTLENGEVIENAELREIGGRTVLVGTGADTGQEEDWTAGVDIGIAWDSVAMYYVMTREQFDEKSRQFDHDTTLTGL